MVKRILLALGDTPFSHVAIRRGIELAQAHGASLVAVTIIDTDYWKRGLGALMSTGQAARMASSRPWVAAEKHVARIVAAFEQACRNASVPFEVRPTDEAPFEQVVRESRYCDLVIFGLRGLFDYDLVPEPQKTIAQLIRRGVRPILAVASEYRTVRRALIAYSGSADSAGAMRHFVQSRLWPDAKLHVACFGESHEQSQELLSEAAVYCRNHGFETTVEAVVAPASGALMPCAVRNDADLIVLGDSFRNVMLRGLLGDTMLELIRGADRPLFVSH